MPNPDNKDPLAPKQDNSWLEAIPIKETPWSKSTMDSNAKGVPEVTEYTDLSCSSSDTANAVLAYLNESVQQEEEPPKITAYVEKATVRLTYRDVRDRYEWDMQLVGFRDGYDALQAQNKLLREACEAAKEELAKVVDECGYWRAYAEELAGHPLEMD